MWYYIISKTSKQILVNEGDKWQENSKGRFYYLFLFLTYK